MVTSLWNADTIKSNMYSCVSYVQPHTRCFWILFLEESFFSYGGRWLSCKWVEVAVWKGDETLLNIAAGTMLLNCIGMTLCDLISVCSCHKHIQTLKIWNQTSKTQRCFHQYLMKIYKTISSRFKNTDIECLPKIKV